MLVKEIISVNFENHKMPINTPRGQNNKTFNTKVTGIRGGANM